jgi:hypothetical protein
MITWYTNNDRKLAVDILDKTSLTDDDISDGAIGWDNFVFVSNRKTTIGCKVFFAFSFLKKDKFLSREDFIKKAAELYPDKKEEKQ